MRHAVSHPTLFFLSTAFAACTSPRAPDVIDAAYEDVATDVPSDSTPDSGCPLVAPMGGGSVNCRSIGTTCTYDSVRCHCDSGGWQCDPIECPTTGVTSGATCPRIGQHFPVEGARCCPADNNFCHSWRDGGVTITATCSGEHWTGVTYTPDDAGDDSADSAPTDVVDASSTD